MGNGRLGVQPVILCAHGGYMAATLAVHTSSPPTTKEGRGPSLRPSSAERLIMRDDWQKRFEKALEFDTWGQKVEAKAALEGLTRSIESHKGRLDLSLFEACILEKIVACLQCRVHVLRGAGDKNGIALDDMKKLRLTFQDLFTKPRPAFLLHVETSDACTLRVVPGAPPTDTDKLYLAFRIEKIGLPKPARLVDPFIRLSVLDVQGRPIENSHDLAMSNCVESSYLVFGGTATRLRTPLHCFRQGSAIYFQLFHYKPGKRKTSLKCWSVMEMDEVNQGAAVLEVYKKPLDPARKKLRLLTNKDLFFHIVIDLELRC